MTPAQQDIPPFPNHHFMKKLLLLITVTILAAVILVQTSRKSAQAQTSTPIAANHTAAYGSYASNVQWGQHLVMVGGCGHCHTPKKMTPQGPEDDSSLLLSGHPASMPPPDVDFKSMQSKGLTVTQTLTAWVGPWGISYGANLTPHQSGLGGWTEQQFVYAIRNGKYKGLPNSRPILPPMPWDSMRFMTDDELKAIFAYLQSIKPIDNVVPQAQPPAA